MSVSSYVIKASLRMLKTAPPGHGEVAGVFAEDPGGAAHLAYHKEAGRVSGVVEEHPGGAVVPDHDHGTVQVVRVVAEEPGDVHQGAGLHSYIRVPAGGNKSGSKP